MEEAVSSGRPGWRWIKAEDKEDKEDATASYAMPVKMPHIYGIV